MNNLNLCFSCVAGPILALLLVACGSENQVEESTDKLHIKGAGATFPAPLYERWVSEYQKLDPAVQFTYAAVGSGEGIRRFIEGTVDFGASDAAMRDNEMQAVAQGVRLIPATAGMIVVAYNVPGVSGNLKLPRDVYLDIFRGAVYRWDDPRIIAANPDVDLPSKLIQVVARRDSSGTTFAFTNHLAAIDNSWRENPGIGKQIDWPGGAMTAAGNSGVAQRIKITEGSIGYVEYGFARRLGLAMATLQNRTGEFVAPSPLSGQSGLASADVPDDLRIFVSDPVGSDAYPIVSYSWFLLYENYPEKGVAKALREAVGWGLGAEGQRLAEEMGYIPLPDHVARLARSSLAQVD